MTKHSSRMYMSYEKNSVVVSIQAPQMQSSIITEILFPSLGHIPVQQRNTGIPGTPAHVGNVVYLSSSLGESSCSIAKSCLTVIVCPDVVVLELHIPLTCRILLEFESTTEERTKSCLDRMQEYKRKLHFSRRQKVSYGTLLETYPNWHFVHRAAPLSFFHQAYRHAKVATLLDVVELVRVVEYVRAAYHQHTWNAMPYLSERLRSSVVCHELRDALVTICQGVCSMKIYDCPLAIRESIVLSTQLRSGPRRRHV